MKENQTPPLPKVPVVPVVIYKRLPFVNVVPVVGPEIIKALPVVKAVALIDKPSPVVRELELIFIVVARVVDISSIWKPTPLVVRIPLKLNLTIPLVGAAVEVVVTKRALPAPVSAVPVVIDSPLPIVRAVALIAIDVPDVSELELIFMVVAVVVAASSIWKPVDVAPVRIPLKLNRTIPVVVALVVVDVTKRALPAPVSVVPVVIDSPVPVVRAVAVICIAVPRAVPAAVRLRAPLVLSVGEVIITLPVLAADDPA